MSSNHLFIEPAQPENAHNHHPCLIEGCPSSCPLYELRKVDGVRNILFNSALDNQKKKACPLTLTEELKPDEIIQIHGKHLLTVYVDRRKRLVLPRKTARKLLHQQAQKSYSQGREDGIKECLVSPEKVLAANKGSGMTVGLEEAICILVKLLNQKQDEQRN